MPNGAPDLSFGTHGQYSAAAPIYAVQVMPNQNIVVASQTYTGTEVVLTALGVNGQIAPAFGSSGVFTYTPAPLENGSTRFCFSISLILQSNQLLIYGKTYAYSGGPIGYCLTGVLVRVTELGQLDTGFVVKGTLPTPYRRDGRHVAANDLAIFLVEDTYTMSWTCNNARDFCYGGSTNLWRYDPNGRPDSKTRVWALIRQGSEMNTVSASGLDGYINGIALDSKGRILAAHTAVDPDKNPNLYEPYARVNLTRLALASDFTRLPVVMR